MTHVGVSSVGGGTRPFLTRSYWRDWPQRGHQRTCVASLVRTRTACSSSYLY
jgi:hypothetical protein